MERSGHLNEKDIKSFTQGFQVVKKELKSSLPSQVESGSELSYLIPETINFAQVNRFPTGTRKSWLKETLK